MSSLMRPMISHKAARSQRARHYELCVQFKRCRTQHTLASFTNLSHLALMNGRKMKFDYDVAIIGGGSGGFAAARTASGAGLKTVVIEGGKEVGGLCILRGCMPSKALLYASEVLHLARQAKGWGLRVPKAGFDFAKVMARKDRMIEDFANCRRKQLENAGFKFIRANARFSDPHTLELSPIDSLPTLP